MPCARRLHLLPVPRRQKIPFKAGGAADPSAPPPPPPALRLTSSRIFFTDSPFCERRRGGRGVSVAALGGGGRGGALGREEGGGLLLAYLPNDAADLLGGEQKQQLGSAERKQARPAPKASQVQNAAFRGKTNSWTPFSAALTSRSRSFFPNPPLLFLLMRCAFKALPRSSRAARAPAGCQGAHSSHRWLMAAMRQWGG